MDSADRSNLQRAFNDYHTKTCIQWVPRSNEQGFVNFVRKRDAGGCAYADNCYNGFQRTATFEQCANWDTFVHEMGHTLCFGHEQDRNDKEKFIKDCGNSRYEHLNFGHLYDYRSIEHYGCHSCLVPTKPGVQISQCGSPSGLSVLDAEKLNDIYNCGGSFFQF